MLMSIRSIQNTKNYCHIGKDDAAEVWSKTKKGGRSKTGRRSIKRAERNNVRKDIAREQITS